MKSIRKNCNNWTVCLLNWIIHCSLSCVLVICYEDADSLLFFCSQGLLILLLPWQSFISLPPKSNRVTNAKHLFNLFRFIKPCPFSRPLGHELDKNIWHNLLFFSTPIMWEGIVYMSMRKSQIVLLGTVIYWIMFR